MIIQIDGATAQGVDAARRGLEAMVRAWGHEIAELPAGTAAARGAAGRQTRGADPVAVAALVLSIPQTALAVVDLADRIGKRRRAKELIDHTQQLAGQRVTVTLISQKSTTEIRTLSPDQLLDLLDGDGPER